MTTANSFSINTANEFSSLPLFQGVEAEVLREIVLSAHIVQYQKGTIFLGHGEIASRAFVVLEGLCGASKINADGQEAILQIFRRGDFLLESVHTPDGDISPVNLRALTPARLLTLSSAVIRHAEHRSSVFACNRLAHVDRLAQNLRDHIEQLLLFTAEQRVGRFLLQQRIYSGPDGNVVVLPFDKALIASFLGIKPETLSRVFQIFRQRGFVIERNQVSLPDNQALCGYCDKITMRTCPFANKGECALAAKDPAPAAIGVPQE